MKYTLKQLESLKTITQGQTDDLKIETETSRIWLSRITKADGQPYDNQVSVEERIECKHTACLFPFEWVTIEQYKAK